MPVVASPKCNILKYVYDYTTRYQLDMPTIISKKYLVNEFLKNDNILRFSQQQQAIEQDNLDQMLTYLLSLLKKTITVGIITNPNTITNPFFTNIISEISASSQDYIAGVDFTQNVAIGTITGTNLQFFTGMVIIAKR